MYNIYECIISYIHPTLYIAPYLLCTVLTISYTLHILYTIYYTCYRYSEYSKESNHIRSLIRIISRKKCTYYTSYNRCIRVHFWACPQNGPKRELGMVEYTRNENPPVYNSYEYTIYEFRSRCRDRCRCW